MILLVCRSNVPEAAKERAEATAAVPGAVGDGAETTAEDRRGAQAVRGALRDPADCHR